MKKLSFESFITWAFLAALTGAVTWSAKFLSDISQSVQELNTKVAIVLQREDFHDKEITDLAIRLKDLENERP